MKERALALRMGGLVRDLREAGKLSQEEFADRCGLHRTYIGAIERGEKMITIETAQKLADALGLSMGALFTRLDDRVGAGRGASRPR